MKTRAKYALILFFALSVISVGPIKIASAQGTPSAIAHWMGAYGTAQPTYTGDYGNATGGFIFYGGRSSGDPPIMQAKEPTPKKCERQPASCVP